jgi:hypothetical protein
LLYRYRLENKFSELIPVNKEREALENLVFLFNSIYSGAIEFEFPDRPDDKDYLIISVWLQKIILIVLKCNIITPIDKFRISIDFADKSLILKHIWREKLLLSEGDEIEKIADDFHFYTKRRIEIQFDNELVTIIIPLFLQEFKDEKVSD